MLTAMPRIINITANDPIEVNEYTPKTDGKIILVTMIINVAPKKLLSIKLICESFTPLYLRL